MEIPSSILCRMKEGDLIVENELQTNYRGQMIVVCDFCMSLNFLCEQPVDTKFSLCCDKRKVVLRVLTG